MADKIMVREFNCETGKTIDREATAEEIAQIKKDEELFAKERAERQALAESKQAILDRLGITEDEAKLLLS